MELEAVKFASDSEVDIEGWLAPHGGSFNGRDLAGEFFSPKTDFVLDWFPDGARPLIWHHGMDAKAGTTVVGRIKALSHREKGLWMQAQLDAHNDYYESIKELIKQSKAGLSSGSMRHLVEVNKASGEILRWPLIEGSLTPTPCEPLLANVDFATAKSHYKAIGIDLPEDEEAFKADLSTERRNQLSDADFAYIDSQGGRHLPMNDAAHARNALARFDQTQFESEEAKAKAKKKLAARAKELGVNVSEDGKALTTDKVPDHPDQQGQPVQKKPALSHDQMRELMATVADEMDMEMSDSEMADMMAKMGDMSAMDENAARARMRQMMAKMRGKSAARSIQLLIDDDSDLDRELGYLPVATHAEAVKILATTLLERTKDLRERRLKEGRILSTASRKRLSDCASSMRQACDDIQALLDSTEPPAKAGDPRLRLELLKLYATTFD